ncbi:uncharacterized protein EAF01_002569 [Botrytis porri]|uniref:Uncharacterized protein n=1 Tax=Botrytis porri TaxID=87229 RepID=A0A4Z1KLU8_9HELO|nr:uncharacterized protein EAF01_002569 [Botrytis porri]KAF7911061.1 hypothetical protein EAF01_002569 [Botrytis porri]TGO86558.1 hypothetical protein BPOR_0293g00050 [Botrytis porri]
MGTAGKAFEALQAGRKAIKQGREYHGKGQEILKGAWEVHDKFQEVNKTAQSFGIDLQKDASNIHNNRGQFKKGARGYARGFICGFWTILKAQAKKYITYVLSLLVFAFIALGLVCFLIAVLSHHSHLQLLTLTTKETVVNHATKGENVTRVEEIVDYNIYLLHYCVTGLTTVAEQKFNMTNGCHHSKQALHDLILPALSTTIILPLSEKNISGPTAEIQTLFKHYGYISFCLYILDIILLPIVAVVFIWWFIATLTPWKRTFRLVLYLFTFTLLVPAVIQTLLIYRVVHILKNDIDFTKSNLDISVKHGFLYMIIAHFFWCTLLFNLILFRLIDWLRNKRKARTLGQTQASYQAQNSQDSSGFHEGNDGIDNTLYDNQSFEMKKMPPPKDSKDTTSITRKPVGLQYDNIDINHGNGDLAEGNPRRNIDFVHENRKNNRDYMGERGV